MLCLLFLHQLVFEPDQSVFPCQTRKIATSFQHQAAPRASICSRCSAHNAAGNWLTGLCRPMTTCNIDIYADSPFRRNRLHSHCGRRTSRLRWCTFHCYSGRSLTSKLGADRRRAEGLHIGQVATLVAAEPGLLDSPVVVLGLFVVVAANSD